MPTIPGGSKAAGRFAWPAGSRGHGPLKGNRHIVAQDTPTSNLLLALAYVGGAEEAQTDCRFFKPEGF